MIRVELIRAWPRRFEATTLELGDGASVGDALERAGWAVPDSQFAGIAVFGQAATLATVLRDGDRIELLRPLQVDPKQARRLRARASRQGNA